MKKSIIITAIAAIAAAGCITTAVVFAGTGNMSNKLNEIDYSNPEQSEAAERVHEESNRLMEEYYQEEVDKGNEDTVDSMGFMNHNGSASARGRSKEYQTDELIEIIKRNGHLDHDMSYADINGMEDYANFVILCCETYNDPQVELTDEEQVKFYNYLDNAYYCLVDQSVEQTDTTMSAYEAIEKTITPKFGYSQTVQRRK